MKKFGINKTNPNPPWPSQQPIVVVPPGSNPTAIGAPDLPMRTMPANRQNMMDNQSNAPMNNSSVNQSFSTTMPQGDEREFPLMDNMPMQRFPNAGAPSLNFGNSTQQGCIVSTGVTEYLCSQIGRYVRIEFLFGDQMHIEKNGIMREVGRNFIVIQEAGTNNRTVCALSKVKFITVYDTTAPMQF